MSLSEGAVAHLVASVRHIHSAARAAALEPILWRTRTAGADAILVAASILGRCDGGCGSSLGRSAGRGLGDARRLGRRLRGVAGRRGARFIAGASPREAPR